LKSLDLIGAIELAYDRTEDEATWLGEITRTIAPAFGGSGAPVTGFVFDIENDWVRLGTTVGFGDDRRYGREDYERQHEAGSRHGRVTRAYDCDMYTLLSRVVGAAEAKDSIEAAGMVGDDALGLRANSSPRSGIILTTHVPTGHRIRSRELWTRFAAHLGAALRVRRLEKAPSPVSATAVMTPNGRLEHGNAETIAAKDALGTAAKAIDRARGKLRRLDPDAAAAVWRTMVRGEWSLVDWYDHDGKRFLLAQENRIPTPVKRALTSREEQVVACAAMGHSNKLIAYDLGLSTGTVAVTLGRAARKLGVSGRVALVRAFKERDET
jgi:DNA-binding CsgD family transcriptional regulator